ncbi:heme peroxidase [Coniochaeta sp. 2T2.1]|nr:heme peroxidase [Coniochaeta sp. 2T2.1]
MRPTTCLFTGLLTLGVRVLADPTWPASTDELEEIMYQLQGFRARLFSDTISPCSNEASGPGRQNAAEWLRVGFHDMATANTYFGIGGLDASLQFELNNGENTGPGHNTTLKFLANYLSSRSSMADLIAAGVYASVRSCGGPVVPVRAGRIDATSGGSPGVPQPQNTIGTFTDQFDRMGFTVPEMIQVVACGHTLGGVHTTEFPDIVPAGTTANGEVALDSTVATFDNKVVTEYLDNSTTNPLVVGPAVKINKHADFKVFSADKNVTMKSITDPAVFQHTCKIVLQKMIDVIPAGVVLTDPVTPYMVKPVNMQLTLNTPGSTLLLSGYIRVRTTSLPISSISNIRLTYKDRNGGSNCGSFGTCYTTATVQGSATGFDDTFAFFPISTNIDATTGISSFTVAINLKDGTSQTYDNNGNSYPMSDAVLLQKPQSCLLQGSGALTATALVRNDRTSLPVNLGVSYLVPRNTANGNPVPALSSAAIAMTKGNCVGQYTFYSASYTIAGGKSFNAKLDIVSGSGADAVADSFNAASELAGTCVAFSGGVACGGSGGSSSTSSSSLSTSSTLTIQTSSTTSTTTSSSTSTIPTLSHRSKIGAYTLVGCWTEGQGTRALTGASFANDQMTLESCMTSCAGFAYWGTEYGRECYCGSKPDISSSSAPLSDCNMLCAGDSTQYCGAGNRLELYSNAAQTSSSGGVTPPTSTSTSTSTSLPTSSNPPPTTTSSTTTPRPTQTTPSHKPTVGAYTFLGCHTEGTGVRALPDRTYADDGMTLESCAAFCDAYAYFGTEYARECWCGASLHSSSKAVPLGECNFLCAGDRAEYCGAGDRLELYKRSS